MSTTKKPKINVRSSTLPFIYVLTPISNIKEKELESSQFIKGCLRRDMQGAVRSYLGYKRLKSLIRKAD